MITAPSSASMTARKSGRKGPAARTWPAIGSRILASAACSAHPIRQDLATGGRDVRSHIDGAPGPGGDFRPVTPRRVGGEHRARSVDSCTPSDGEEQGEPAHSRLTDMGGSGGQVNTRDFRLATRPEGLLWAWWGADRSSRDPREVDRYCMLGR